MIIGGFTNDKSIIEIKIMGKELSLNPIITIETKYLLNFCVSCVIK
jgi:hypothetical protein